QPMVHLSNLKFFDVWHGIPFKGFDSDDFQIQRQYDETWVASPLLAGMYVEKFGFRKDRVWPTGYPRTDRLVRETEPIEELRSRLGLPALRPVVLFAPTWTQDENNRSIFPFGTTAGEFIATAGELAVRCGATV